MPDRARVVVWILIVVGFAGCRPTPTVVVPLLDGRHYPDILIETQGLRRPTTWSGHRFVSGWQFDREPGGLRVRPTGPIARLELTHLENRERSLVLHSVTAAGSVTLGVAGQELGVYEFQGPIRVQLPPDLPIGRVPVTLEFSEPDRVVLAGAALRPTLEAGAVEIEADVVTQSGWSIVDVSRLVESASVLEGDFVPPSDPAPGQRFAVVLDRGRGEPRTVFEWRPEVSGTRHSDSAFEAGLVGGRGLVRVRLVAEGDGPAARWQGLRIRTPRARGGDERRKLPRRLRLVVLYVMDALRADAIGHLGSGQGASPVLDRLAAEGVSFARHFSVAPNTPVSTRALFSGWCLVRGGELARDGPPTLAESFGAAGYRTASVSSNPYLSPARDLVRGFDEVEFIEFVEDFRPGAAATPNDSADQVHRAALSWLEGLADDDRGFLYLHTLNPHNPYTPPEPYPERFTGDSPSQISGGTKTLVDIRESRIDVGPEDMAKIRGLYTAGVAYNDDRLGAFVSAIERSFAPGEFLLVVTSDHGEELFDHGGVLHGHTLYDEMLHIPLIVWWPSVIEAHRVDALTDTLDLHATLVALVDDRAPRWSEGGEPLWPLIYGAVDDFRERRLRFAFAAGGQRIHMARSEGWKLILAPNRRLEWGMGHGRGRSSDAEYAFRLGDDPREQSNLAGSAELEVAWLRSRLLAWVETWSTRQSEVVRPEVDEETRRRLEALGYTE